MGGRLEKEISGQRQSKRKKIRHQHFAQEIVRRTLEHMLTPSLFKGSKLAFSCALAAFFITSCDRIRPGEPDRKPVARVESSYLYHDELQGITPPGTPETDSAQRVEAYVDSWIRKQLLIQEATRKMDINEAEVE